MLKSVEELLVSVDVEASGHDDEDEMNGYRKERKKTRKKVFKGENRGEDTRREDRF